jgi:hypothetical protein
MKVTSGLLSSSVRDVSIAVLALTGAFAAGRYALADGPTPAAPRVIPYEGILELNGESVAGTRSFAFEIWDSPGTGGTKLWPIDATPDGLLESVPITNGRFAVQLGGDGMDALPDAVFSAPATYLTVAVDGTPLSNRQRLVNPWLAANGPVTINGTLDVNGALVASTATVEGGLGVGGDARVTGLDYDGTAGGVLRLGSTSPMVLDDDEINASVGERLYLNPRTRAGVKIVGDQEADGTPGTGSLYIEDDNHRLWMDGDEIDSSTSLIIAGNSLADTIIGRDLEVNNDLDVARDLTVGANSWGRGPEFGINNPYIAGGFDQQVNCPTGRYVCGLNFKADGRLDGASCCTL